MLHIYTKGTAKITCNGKSEMIEGTNSKNMPLSIFSSFEALCSKSVGRGFDSR
jgi:hypothetical protein